MQICHSSLDSLIYLFCYEPDKLCSTLPTPSLTSAESKPDYASIISRSSQAPKVEIGTENLLTVNDDEVRVPNILCQQVELSMKSSQSLTIPTN